MKKKCYYDYFEIFKIDLPYIQSGWLDGKGRFHKCSWGEHTNMAFELINKNGWYMNFRNVRSERLSENGRDYLVKEKKFICLDNPTKNERTQVITYNPLCKHTKSQINALLKLFEYSEEMTMYILENFCNE